MSASETQEEWQQRWGRKQVWSHPVWSEVNKSKGWKYVQELIKSAETIQFEMSRTRTWYHVIERFDDATSKVYGFAVENGSVVEAPYEKSDWIGMELDVLKYCYFVKGKNIQVTKVGEVCYFL